MKKWNLPILTVVTAALAVLLAGCVERRLTINTNPQDALVVLNDEEIGQSPVTVPFNWYGDYNVRISKEGYETLSTHRPLKSPWYDKFPWDFFAQIVSPKKIRDSYEWTFELSPQQQPDREQLIQRAQDLKEKLD
ncbi:MAG: PEGA domain-containing protein [Sedimentisphaerales bacterium]|nr:PEGA domain-containing protein [Sedimentisphaerales bacterium]